MSQNIAVKVPDIGNFKDIAIIEEATQREAAEIRKKYPPESFGDIDGGDAPAWALESHGLGYDLAYGMLPAGSPVPLGQEYVAASRACAEKLIALAGYRLAALLNHLLNPPVK